MKNICFCGCVIPIAAVLGIVCLCLYAALATAVARKGVAYWAYPCIDTIPNEICDTLLSPFMEEIK